MNIYETKRKERKERVAKGNLFAGTDLMMEAVKMVQRVSEEHPEIPLGDYIQRYSPFDNANECCYKCWKSTRNGCSWAKSFMLPNGAISAMTANSTSESIKIFWCPEFSPESEMPEDVKKKGYDYDGCVNLLCAIAKEVADDYRYTLMEIKKQRILYLQYEANPKIKQSKLDDILMRLYQLLRHKKSIERDVLPEHYKSLQSQCKYRNSPKVDGLAIQLARRKNRMAMHEDVPEEDEL